VLWARGSSVKAAQDSEVPTRQSPTVFSQSTDLSDLNQKKRTNIQYPEEPITEPVRRKRNVAREAFAGRVRRNGTHTIEPTQNARRGVATLHTTASVAKPKAVIGRASFRSRSETMMDVACKRPINP